MIIPFESEYLDDNTWVVYTRCPHCGRINCLEVSTKQLCELEHRTRCVQNILPDHSPAEREYLITGTCEKCYREMLGMPEAC